MVASAAWAGGAGGGWELVSTGMRQAGDNEVVWLFLKRPKP